MGRRLFDIGAAPYDWATNQSEWLASCGRMAALLPPMPVPCGIDLGCGSGISTVALARAFPDARWIAADFSLPMLRRARPKIRTARAVPVAADARALPFRDGAFGAAAAHSLLYLIPGRLQALRETVRVLAPGAGFVYLEPYPQVGAAKMAGIVARNLAAPRFAASMLAWRVAGAFHARIWPEDSVALALAAGFGAAEVTETLDGLGYFVRATKS